MSRLAFQQGCLFLFRSLLNTDMTFIRLLGMFLKYIRSLVKSSKFVKGIFKFVLFIFESVSDFQTSKFSRNLPLGDTTVPSLQTCNLISKSLLRTKPNVNSVLKLSTSVAPSPTNCLIFQHPRRCNSPPENKHYLNHMNLHHETFQNAQNYLSCCY